MLPDVSVVVVSHRSAPEAALCVGSLREAFAREGIEGEVVLVDCASGEEDARQLARLPLDLFLPLPENRGYSGGANAGLARSRGWKLIVSNADVVYLPEAVTELLRALDDPTVGAAAPLCCWDADGKIRLPPGFAPGFLRDLAQLSAGRWPHLDRRRFAAFARETLLLWERGGDVRHLSGAVLATRREVFDRAGRFDEQYLFEYEETEWEERLRATGFKLRFVPKARVLHLYARSAARNPESRSRRAASQRLYRRRRYGRVVEILLRRAESLSLPPSARRLDEPRIASRPGAMLAISLNASLLPFAGVSLSEEFRLSPELASSLPPGPVYLRVFRAADGEPLETYVWEKPS